MIRVGFIFTSTKKWMGGLNYYINLLYAISILDDKKIEPVVFTGLKRLHEVKEIFGDLAQVVGHPVFDRKSLQWVIWKISYRLFRTNLIMDMFLKKHQIQVLSHSGLVGFKKCKTVNWIPDFQHLHLCEMFTQKEINNRNRYFLNIAENSDIIILSSQDAFKDFKTFSPHCKKKARVLRFVSQPYSMYHQFNEDNERRLREKYNIPEPFFYFPGQYWQHKNHMIVFKAIKILKESGVNAYLICTGYMYDYRKKDYFLTLRKYIFKNSLENNIRLHGLVDRQDLYALIKFSKAVMNPSLFEGWSSTVEECKSVGKIMILSDINVHKEQYPEALFFEKNNVKSLTGIIEGFDDLKKKTVSIGDLKVKTKNYANNYENIIMEALTKN